MSASGARYWLIARLQECDRSSTGGQRRGRFEQSRANHLLVELADARLRDRVDEVHAVGNRVLRDGAALRIVVHVPPYRVLGHAPGVAWLADDERDRALTPAIIRNADDGDLADARRTQDDVL